MAKTYILDKAAIALKLSRMALEIAERNTDVNRIVLLGIEPNGKVMAQKIKTLLKEWFHGDIDEITIELNKRKPTEVSLSAEIDLNDTVVILVDDVANSGKTLTYALKPVLKYYPQKIQTLVLVERTYKEFPITPDYVGVSIATAFKDFIAVEVEGGEVVGAWVDQDMA